MDMNHLVQVQDLSAFSYIEICRPYIYFHSLQTPKLVL